MNFMLCHRTLPMFGLIALVGLPAADATAQESVEEVLVTARQREEAISDVPASITAFSAQDIERAGIKRAPDFIALTPGVSLVNTAEVGDTQVSIRGINGTRDGEANFAFIVDGILHTNPSAFNREFADVQQIEILKGPQGALYGRSAASGAMIVTTRAPGEEFEADARASAGSQDTYTVSAGAGGALVPNQLFGRVHVDYRDTDGFYKNTFQDNSHIVDDFENYNVNGRLKWDANEDLSFDFKAHYGEVDAAAIGFNSVFALPVFGSVPRGAPLFEEVNEHQFVFQNNVDPQNDQESMDFSLKMDYDLDWAMLTGWFLYSDVEQSFLADGTSGAFGFFAGEPACVASAAALAAAGQPFPAPTFNTGNPAPFAFVAGGSFYGAYTPTTCDGYQYQTRNQDDRSFEFRLTSKADQQLRWQVGFYHLDLDRQVGVAQLVDDGSALFGSLVNPLTEALVSDDFETSVWAVFGNV